MTRWTNLENIKGPPGPPAVIGDVTAHEAERASASARQVDHGDGRGLVVDFDFGIPPGRPGDAGDRGKPGPAGPAGSLTIGSVTGGTDAAATITGEPGAQVLNLTLPKGAAGAPGAPGPASLAPNEFELRGNGSPYGVVTPPSAGVYYTDALGTCGAWRWIATGTDRYSWQVTHGDTQWRGASLPADVFTPGSYFQLRRQNGLLLVRCGLAILPSANVPQIARAIFPNLSGEWLPLAGQYESAYGFLAYRDNGPDGQRYGKVGVWGSSWGADVLERIGEYRLYYEGAFSPRSARWPVTLPGNQSAG